MNDAGVPFMFPASAQPGRVPTLTRYISNSMAGKARSTCCLIWRGGKKLIYDRFRSLPWWINT